MQLKKYILVYTIIPMLLLLSASAYYRFVIQQDYMVSYEGECDPITESCFVGCEDDECTSEFFYTIVERKAADIYALCGENILECDAAYACSVNEHECSITYCDPEFDGESCETVISENNEATTPVMDIEAETF